MLLSRSWKHKPTGIPESHKWCPACGFVKDRENEFHKSSRSKDGSQSWCKPCLLASNKRSYATRNKDKPGPKPMYDKNGFRIFGYRNGKPLYVRKLTGDPKQKMPCSMCERVLPVSEFGRHERRGEVVARPHCHECARKISREWKQKNRYLVNQRKRANDLAKRILKKINANAPQIPDL